MSGNIAELLARPIGIDVLTPMKKYQELAQGQEQTRLVGEQATGAGIANQLAGMNLAKTGFFYGLAGIPGAPGGGGGAGAGGMPAGGVLGAAAVPGSVAGQAQAAGQGAAAAPGAYPGQFGNDRIGVPMPPLIAAGVLTAQDQTKAAHEANETRRQIMHQAIAGAPPEQYVDTMKRLMQAGWVTPVAVEEASRNPAGRARALAGLQTPEAYQSALTAAFGQGARPNEGTGQPEVSPVAGAATERLAAARAGGEGQGALPTAGPLAGARAGATAAATAPYETTTLTVPDPADPTKLRSVTVQRSQLPAFMAENAGARPASAADHVNPAVELSPAAYSTRVRGAENTTGNPAARNSSGPGGTPTSTAMGDGQFTEGTWTATVGRSKPAWAQGLTPAQLQAARADPAKSAEMTYALAQHNGPLLARAGVPVNSLTLGMAHQFGPEGAARLLTAPANTKVSALVSQDVMDANPNLKNATVATVRAEKFEKFGVNAVNLSAPWVAEAPAAAGGVPGAIAGAPVLTPVQQEALKLATNQAEAERPTVQASMEAARQAQTQQLNIETMQDLGRQIENSGTGGDARAEVAKWAATYLPPKAAELFEKYTGGLINPSKAAVVDAFRKAALTASGTANKAVNESGGIQSSELYLRAYPNMTTMPEAVQEVSNVLRVTAQQAVDWADNRQRHFEGQVAQLGDTGKYRTVTAADREFLKTNPPQVYAGAMAVLNGKPPEKWSKGLTQAEGEEVLRTVWRVDPGFVLTLPNGAKRTAPR